MALWNNTDAEASKPKYLSDELVNDETVSALDSTAGVSVVEAQTAANIAKGINTPGWVLYRTYEDSAGQTRHKVETLVAMKTISGDSDALPPTATLSVTVANISVPTGETTGTFASVVTSNYGGSFTYQWSYDDGVSGFQDIVGATSANLTVSDEDTDLWVTGYTFKVVVTSTDVSGLTAEDTATLTIEV
jgi:hypothetical protein